MSWVAATMAVNLGTQYLKGRKADKDAKAASLNDVAPHQQVVSRDLSTIVGSLLAGRRRLDDNEEEY